MRKLKRLLLIGSPIALFLATACHKNDMPPLTTGTTSTTGTTTTTDSLAQTYYTTIDSLGTPAPGIILACPIITTLLPIIDSPGVLLIMNQDGQILKKKSTAGQAYNFQRWIINGQIRYTYVVNNPNAYRTGDVDDPAGYYVIADSSLNTLQQVNFTAYAGDTAAVSGQALDVHDFVLISDNDYIIESYVIKNVGNIPSYVPHYPNEAVVAPLIEEIQNGSVVWYWDAAADTSFYANAATGNVYTDSAAAQDYVHLNSMYIDPRDNNLIISMRNQCQIRKLNRQTGATMWKLGGKNSDFTLDSAEVFLYQHHATLVDSNKTLLIFDDGDPTLRPYSRVLEFQLDETDKLVTGFKSFTIPEPFTDVMGSVQKIGNDYFIGGGSGNYILDVNYTTGQKVVEMISNQYATYRAFKYLTP